MIKEWLVVDDDIQRDRDPDAAASLARSRL
jgi:hypothetical protein